MLADDDGDAAAGEQPDVDSVVSRERIAGARRLVRESGADDSPEPLGDTHRLAWELAIDAAGVGTFDWDLATGALAWDHRLLDLFGLDEGGFGGTIDAFNERVHPDDLSRVTQALQRAIDTCSEYAAEYRVLRPDGRTVWVAARGRAVCDGTGTATRVLGAAYDTTAAHDADARVARVLESMTAAFFLLDRQWRFAYVNHHAEQLLAMPRDRMVGGNIWELFPYAIGSDFERHYRSAMETGRPHSFEAYYPAPLDGWYEVQAWPDPAGLSVYFLDVTERHAAQERVERAARSAQLLAQVTAALAETHDAEEAATRLAELVVPELADWCLVTVVDDENPDMLQGLHDVGIHHRDPSMQEVVREYAALRLTAFTGDAYLLRTLREGEPVVVTEDATAGLLRVLRSGPAHRLVEKLAPRSFALLPLRGRGRVVGALSLFNGSDRGPINDRDLATATDVAGRAGLALDNARLYRQQRNLAESLQRSMLTEPPAQDGLEIAVRYTAAAEAAQVGGDWYDAFRRPDGSTVVVIGDVIGHDAVAAAAMGQVRTLLRGIAVTTGAGPAELLHRVDHAMETLQLGTTATVVVARIWADTDAAGERVTRMRWSNAGHPPPLIVGADGTVTLLAGEVNDLLLGIAPEVRRAEAPEVRRAEAPEVRRAEAPEVRRAEAPEVRRAEADTVIEAGATMLLYTDGLVERREQDLDEGLARLQSVLATMAADDGPLDALCDRLLERMLPDRQADDVALVAIRPRGAVPPS